MAIVPLYPLFAFFIISHAFCGIVVSKTFEIKTLEQCPTDDPIEGDFHIETNKDGRALYVNANLEDSVNENYVMILELYYLKDGNWEIHRQYDDTWCNALNFVVKPWTLAKAAAEPPLPDGCDIPPGKYAVNGFQLTSNDVASYLSIFEDGSYKLHALLKDDDDRGVVCVDLEGELKGF